MDKQFLRSADFNKQSILDNVLAPHNNDGVHAIHDLRALVHEEHVRQFSTKLFYFGLGGSLFSAYNITRMSQLSPSGKPAAIVGLAFFGLLAYSSAWRSGMIGRKAAPATQ